MKRNNILKYITACIPFICILFFLFFINKGLNGHFFQFVDSSFLVTKINSIKEFGHLWNMRNFGLLSLAEINSYTRLISYCLLSLNLSTKNAQLVFYFFIFNLIFYSAWFFFRKILLMVNSSNSFFPSFFAALFYSFNINTSTGLRGGIVDSLFVFLATAPAITYFILSALLQKNNLRNTAVLGVLIGINLDIFPFNIALYIPLFLIYFLLSKKKLKEKISFALLIGIIATLTGLYFMVILYYAFFHADPFPLVNPASLLVISPNGISGIFRFFFDWTIKAYWNNTYHFPLFPYYNGLLSIFSSYFIWILCMCSVLFVYKNKSSKHLNNIFMFVFLTISFSVFLDKGIQDPLKEINALFYRYIPFFGVFRTPDTKFAYPILIGMSLLIGIFFAKANYYILKILLAICVVIQIFPFFIGQAILDLDSKTSFSNIVQVPNEYLSTSSIINKDTKEGYLLFYPPKQHDEYDYKNGGLYNGPDILGQLVNRPVVYGDNTIIFANSKKTYFRIIENIKTINPGRYGIRYIFVRKDYLSDRNSPVFDNIKSNSYLQEVEKNKLGILYMVSPKYYYPLITSEGSKITKIVQERNTYNIELSFPDTIKSDTFSVIYRSSYTPMWQIKKNSLIQSIRHVQYDDVFNKWKIQLTQEAIKNNKINIKLEYIPETSRNYAFYISVGTILIVTIGLWIDFANKKRNLFDNKKVI